MKRITVFCGSSNGNQPIYCKTARSLGQYLARQDIELVYGGAQVGVMGAVADGCMDNGGKVIGVIPKFLKTKEVAHPAISEMIVVDTMHQRKVKMNDLSDGIIALPGGFGTLEELFEILTWGQLGLHKMPMGLLNINGYYDSLITMIQTMVDNGFLKKLNQDMLLVSDDYEKLLDKMRSYVAPDVPKWIHLETT